MPKGQTAAVGSVRGGAREPFHRTTVAKGKKGSYAAKGNIKPAQRGRTPRGGFPKP